MTFRVLLKSAMRMPPRPHLAFSRRPHGTKAKPCGAAALGIQGFSGFDSAEKDIKYESFKPQIDSKLTDLLKGMASATAEDVGAGVRAIRLGKGARFILHKTPSDSTIYERSFYPRLVSAIRGLSLRVILVSNPGTGKSVFQYYLLTRYLSPALFKDNDVPPPETINFGPTKGGEAPKVVIRHLPTVRMEVWFLEQQVVHVIEPGEISMSVLQCFDPETAVYFFEPGKTNGIEPYGDDFTLAIPTLLTVPPDPSRYKQTSKDASKAYMPVFTKAELLAIGRDMRGQPGFCKELQKLYTDKGIGARFDVFNGNIRHVLPLSNARLANIYKERQKALWRLDVVKYLRGSIENGWVSDNLAIYNVDKNDFTTYELTAVAADVSNLMNLLVQDISLHEKIDALKCYSKSGSNNFHEAAAIYESLVAHHLTSAEGVSWMQRSVSVTDSPNEDMDGAVVSGARELQESLFPLSVKLTKSTSGVPRFANMEPNVLYRWAASMNSPRFCDMLYLTESGEGEEKKQKLVCVHVSIEGQASAVKPTAFKAFCEKHMGWGPVRTKSELALIEYVCCPLPSLASSASAAVSFGKGMGIGKFTVWHVDPNFYPSMTEQYE